MTKNNWPGSRTRQGPEHDCIEKIEDSRVRSDAEGEREHGHSGEAGAFQQLAEGVAKVIKHSKEGTSEFRDVVEGCKLRRIPARPSTIQEMVETMHAIESDSLCIARARGQTQPIKFTTTGE